MITERHLARAGYPCCGDLGIRRSEAIKRAVADGIGVSLISQLLVERGRSSAESWPPFRISGLDRMTRPIYAVQPSLAELTPHAAWFTTLMMDAHRAPASAEQLS